ncbi:hypothetical protein TorRG33x02_245010 [Trema orientale]|uniref:Uncharacterized protein n=1 Tax=Trema orientale TaxID=63057 RepID=A0A2P5DQT3_TREOI|nr:hypothetical protein TorRG33x02_245010 [Trema orientale]
MPYIKTLRRLQLKKKKGENFTTHRFRLLKENDSTNRGATLSFWSFTLPESSRYRWWWNQLPAPSQPPPPPPPKINVQKFAESRAAEFESLHSTVADRLSGDFRSRRSKRRRTTAFDNKAAKRRRKGQRRNLDDSTNKKKKNDGENVAVRACFRNGVLIHDASYYVAVQLEGPEDSLLSILSMVLVPSPSARAADGSKSDSVISGVIYDKDAPSCRDNDVAAINGQGFTKPESTESKFSSSFRQIWVWIRASAFSEGYDGLKFACQKEDSRGFLATRYLLVEDELKKNYVFESSKAVFSLIVMDPRSVTKNRMIPNAPESASRDMLDDIPGTETGEHAGKRVSFARKNMSCIRISFALTIQIQLRCNAQDVALLFLKDENKEGLAIGAFWVPLVSMGAHAIGLREKHWVACEAATSILKGELCSPSMGPLRVSIPLPWDIVRVTLNRLLKTVGDLIDPTALNTQRGKNTI